ncbi:hypothetical protein F5B21DRAFT_491279 [Xylaria acuta]|nr:hypothetical protein F5B21DRAFT_491279 [Xylaria acuta]
MWAGGRAGAGSIDAPYIWRAIMVNGWATRSTTLSSLLLRTITVAQATICTSLVAALLIEQRQTPISQIARLSITRGVNGGPLQLLQHGIFTKSAKQFFCLESLLLVPLVITGLGIQFSSTILLFDFKFTNLARFQVKSSLNFILSPEALNATQQSIVMEVIDYQTFALFGESEPAGMATPNQRGFYDSGLVRRAFLPLQEPGRTSLNYIRGPLFTLSTRVFCMRPSIRGLPIAFTDEAGKYAAIAGNIDYNQTFESAGMGMTDPCPSGGNRTGCWSSHFNTTIATLAGDGPTWATSLYPLEIPGVGIGNLEDPALDRDLPGATSNTWPFLLFATNAVYNNWLDYEHDNITLGQSTGVDEWNSYELSPGIVLNATLCFVRLKTSMDTVGMKQAADDLSPEPLVQTSIIPNETEVKRAVDLLGANVGYKTPADRRVLSIATNITETASPMLSQPGSGVEDDAVSATLDRLRQAFWLTFGPDAKKISWAVCDDCRSYGYHLPRGTQKVGEYIVNSRGRPSAVIETFLTMAAQKVYYYFLSAFDVTADFESVSVGSFEIPRAWNGFAAVTVLVMINLSCVLAITAIFIVRSKFTRCGDIWHTISQIVSEPVLEVLGQCDNVTDTIVEKTLREKDFSVSIIQCEDGGKIRVERAM